MAQTKEILNKQKVLRKGLTNKLNFLDKQLRVMTRELKKERKEGQLSEAELSYKLQESQLAMDKISAQLKKAKEGIKKRKKEIKKWKEDYNIQDQLDKSAEWARLSAEIAWRSQEIISTEAMVASMYAQKTVIEGAVEAYKVKLQIFKEGHFNNDIKEDPRLRAITEERDAIEHRLDKLNE